MFLRWKIISKMSAANKLTLILAHIQTHMWAHSKFICSNILRQPMRALNINMYGVWWSKSFTKYEQVRRIHTHVSFLCIHMHTSTCLLCCQFISICCSKCMHSAIIITPHHWNGKNFVSKFQAHSIDTYRYTVKYIYVLLCFVGEGLAHAMELSIDFEQYTFQTRQLEADCFAVWMLVLNIYMYANMYFYFRIRISFTFIRRSGTKVS